ncbi:HSF-type DNA-binding-domain-containing protein [Mycena floridula]|nr:HSF-type DNA-binding-domain-containing protein [Mycena floridula]
MADLYPPNYNLKIYPPTMDNSNELNVDKPESKPQATFLTKLYALLERPENHHMIRWDPQGEHIIVERPEQLALHVLPSIYRQSRFASFSRQLNIYGFMRKVNLRNVDPAIDDPDASTWSHPTLNRHSPAEVVANFKRRVPPRLPKPRKRDSQEQQQQQPPIPPPRSATGLGPVPLTVPSHKINHIGRSRGFSAPGSFTPVGSQGWQTNTYPRSNLPPLTVPSDVYHHHSMQSPAEESPSSATFNTYPSYSSYHHHQSDAGQWAASHNGSLSSLLNPNPSNHYSQTARPQPTINTNYSSPFSSMPMHHAEHSASSMSPDSRPATGYSMSSVSSLPYEDPTGYGSRPNSSHHHRPPSPSSRPQSSNSKSYSQASLSIRRARRHSQAVTPYPSPYEHGDQQRPSTSPQPIHDGDHHHHSHSVNHNGIPRVRSMIQLPAVDPYGFNPHQADFAYSAAGTGGPMNGSGNGRPSTSASSISAASHTSSSQANTPPVSDGYGGEVNRFSPDFGFVPMNEHLNTYAKSNVEM